MSMIGETTILIWTGKDPQTATTITEGAPLTILKHTTTGHQARWMIARSARRSSLMLICISSLARRPIPLRCGTVNSRLARGMGAPTYVTLAKTPGIKHLIRSRSTSPQINSIRVTFVIRSPSTHLMTIKSSECRKHTTARRSSRTNPKPLRASRSRSSN